MGNDAEVEIYDCDIKTQPWINETMLQCTLQIKTRASTTLYEQVYLL